MNSTRRRNLVEKLLASQRGLCYWCRNPCVLAKEHDAEKAVAKREKRNAKGCATIDHLWPVGHKRRNKDRVAACKKCNQHRGNPAEHLLFEPEGGTLDRRNDGT